MKSVFLSVVLCLAAVGLLTIPTHAQSRKSTKPRIGRTVSKADELNKRADWHAISQQIDDLVRIYWKYESDDAPGFVWCRNEIWQDLLTIRTHLDPVASKSPGKRRLHNILATQFQMEIEVLRSLTTDQVTYIADELELSPNQMDDFIAIVDRDVDRKHRLINSAMPTGLDQLFTRFSEITNMTEVRLEGMLSPDQWKSYSKLKAEALRQRTFGVA